MTRTVTQQRPWKQGMTLFAGLATLMLAAGAARAEHGYSYLRTLEGYADVQSADDGDEFEAVENQPLIPGDLLIVGSNSRAEAVLSDGAILRLAGGTEVLMGALAWTPDTGDTSTRLVLRAGEIQVVLGDEVGDGGPLQVEAGNASVYLEAPGEYRVRANGYDSTEVLVRDGFAEVQTDRGSAIVRSSEVGYVEGTDWANVELARAGSLSRLEGWGDELDAEARLAENPYIEPELRYRAARMSNYGSWLEIEGRRGWQPHVASSWRPYVDGRWAYTPSGLTWISYEPWGWVPSHYGSWDLVPGRGWVWFAGARYTPASVYWYWGPTHVGWVPAGYYTSFYSSHHSVVPRFGVYGWAGGSWNFFAEWTFCPTRYFGRPRYDQYYRSGHEVARHATYREIPRGVIATDTRSLTREVWGQPERITERLTNSRTRLVTGEMPDVTDFVARRRDVSPRVAEIVRPQEMSTVRRGRPAVIDARERQSVRATVVGSGRPSLDSRPELKRDASPRGDAVRPTFERSDSERSDTARPTADRGSVRSVTPRPSWETTSAPRPTGRPAFEIVRPRATLPERDHGVAPPAIGRYRESAPAVVPEPRNDRSVVRRVIDQMRSRQTPTPSPQATRQAPKPAPTQAAPPPRRESSGASRASVDRSPSRRPPSASSSSGSSRGRGSSASSSNRSSGSRQSTSSKARSRKPPRSDD